METKQSNKSLIKIIVILFLFLGLLIAIPMIVVFIGIAAIPYQKAPKPKDRLESSFNIELPSNYKTLYNLYSPTFTGSAMQYCVIEFSEAPTSFLEQYSFINEKGEYIENIINSNIILLEKNHEDFEEQYKPNFDIEYSYYQNGELNIIYYYQSNKMIISITGH